MKAIIKYTMYCPGLTRQHGKKAITTRPLLRKSFSIVCTLSNPYEMLPYDIFVHCSGIHKSVWNGSIALHPQCQAATSSRGSKTVPASHLPPVHGVYSYVLVTDIWPQLYKKHVLGWTQKSIQHCFNFHPKKSVTKENIPIFMATIFSALKNKRIWIWGICD